MKITKSAAGPLKPMQYDYAGGYEKNLENAKNLKKSSGMRVFVNYEHWTSEKIRREGSGWIGTSGGLKGFLKKTVEELENGEYEYTPDSDGPIRIKDYRWIKLDYFNQIYNYRKSSNLDVISKEFEEILKDKGLYQLLTHKHTTAQKQ